MDIDFQHMACKLQQQMQDHIITEELCKRLWMTSNCGEHLYMDGRIKLSQRACRETTRAF